MRSLHVLKLEISQVRNFAWHLIWTVLLEKNVAFLLWKGCIFQIFWTSFGLRLHIWKRFWTLVGLGLSFKKSGLDLDRKMWQSAHLWSTAKVAMDPKCQCRLQKDSAFFFRTRIRSRSQKFVKNPIRSHFSISAVTGACVVIGVRGGRAGRTAAPRLENFQGKLCFQGKRKLLENSE